MPLLRLDKYISDLTEGSRREVRDWIRSGRVCVDGLIVRTPETKLDPDKSPVTLNGEPLVYERFLYYMMDKPEGTITATEDKSQQTVLDLLPPELRRRDLFPVGRLDKDTSGLLLLTNDGDFAHRVMSPKSGIVKRYLALVNGMPDENDVVAFQEGLLLSDGTKCLPADLELLEENRCMVSVQEGKYHQVKRMLASRGKPVLTLRRVSIGALDLDESLGPGGIRPLQESELCTVFMDRKTKTREKKGIFLADRSHLEKN